jgi:hypothetical protein
LDGPPARLEAKANPMTQDTERALGTERAVLLRYACDGGWRRGSGLRIGGTLVLTPEHCARDPARRGRHVGDRLQFAERRGPDLVHALPRCRRRHRRVTKSSLRRKVYGTHGRILGV